MSQGDILGPDELNDALLEVQKNQLLHHKIVHYRPQKTNESPQHRKIHGKNILTSCIKYKSVKSF